MSRQDKLLSLSLEQGYDSPQAHFEARTAPRSNTLPNTFPNSVRRTFLQTLVGGLATVTAVQALAGCEGSGAIGGDETPEGSNPESSTAEFDLANFADLPAAIQKLPQPATLLIASEFAVNEDVTVPQHISLRFAGSGKLSVAEGTTLMIEGPFTAPLTQVFSDKGRVLLGDGAMPEVYPQWWGAKADAQHVPGGFSGTDDGPAVQRAVDALPPRGGTVMFLDVGAYLIATTVRLPGNNPGPLYNGKRVNLKGQPVLAYMPNAEGREGDYNQGVFGSNIFCQASPTFLVNMATPTATHPQVRGYYGFNVENLKFNGRSYEDGCFLGMSLQYCQFNDNTFHLFGYAYNFSPFYAGDSQYAFSYNQHLSFRDHFFQNIKYVSIDAGRLADACSITRCHVQNESVIHEPGATLIGFSFLEGRSIKIENCIVNYCNPAFKINRIMGVGIDACYVESSPRVFVIHESVVSVENCFLAVDSTHDAGLLDMSTWAHTQRGSVFMANNQILYNDAVPARLGIKRHESNPDIFVTSLRNSFNYGTLADPATAGFGTPAQVDAVANKLRPFVSQVTANDGALRHLAAKIEVGSTNRVSLQTLPKNSLVTNVRVHVVTPFNGSPTSITVGIAEDVARYGRSDGLQQPGPQAVTLGTYLFDGPQAVVASYTFAGTAPTVGTALVVVEYYVLDV